MTRHFSGCACCNTIGPALIIRKAPHGPVWSVWATLEGTHSEEIFKAFSEDEASNWINTDGHTWLEERRQKRNSLPSQSPICPSYFLSVCPKSP
jgi:hypothetical protein